MKFNKLKLIYHVICMKNYYDYLKKNKYKVEYFSIKQLKKFKI